jgi:hypothetical protein
MANCTLPTGTPAPGNTAATVAVHTTLCPYTLGFTLLPTVVAVAAAPTTCDKATLVLPAWLLSPPYVAVMLSVPTANCVVTHVATPLTSAEVVQPAAPVHVTLPVATRRPAPFFSPCNPYVGVTVAVSVTLCPHTDGFTLLVTTVAVGSCPTTCCTLL